MALAVLHRVEVKELKLRPNTDVHDYQVRLRSAQKFLEKGNKVKLTLQFKGREMEFRDIGQDMFQVRGQAAMHWSRRAGLS